MAEDFDQSSAQAVIASDPQIQAILEQARQDPLAKSSAANRMGYQQAMAKYEPQIAARLQQLGVTLPKGYGVNLHDGTIGHDNWFFRNAPWLVPAALGGAAIATGLAGAAGGGAAAAPTSAAAAPSAAVPTGVATGVGETAAGVGGAGAASTAGPLAADEVFTAGPVAGTGLSGVDLTGMGAVGASTGFGAALKAALPTIIGAGASLGGAAIAAHGNTEAAKIAAAQADKALAQAKEIYQQQRADQSPYRSLGASALGPLSFGLGLPTPTSSAGPLDNPSTVVASGAKDANGQPLPGAGQNQVIPPPPTPQQEFGTLGKLGASPSTGDLVPIRNQATGLVHLIPGDQVPSALQAGGMRV